MVGYEKRIDDRKIMIGITEIPNRRRLYLRVLEGNVIHPYASFSYVDKAYEFMDAFADFIGAKRVDWFGRDE